VAANFKVWTANFGKQSASAYYRILVPQRCLMEMGYANAYSSSAETQEDFAAMLYSDVAQLYAIIGDYWLQKVKRVNAIHPAIRDGQPIYPPSFIYDIDDNNDYVHPFNMFFNKYGVREYPTNKLLKPGDGLEIMDHNGKQISQWVDKETVYDGVMFDVERNLRDMKLRHELLRECQGVTCPSLALANYFKQVVGVQSTYFFPNTIVPSDYKSFPVQRKNPTEIRIVWQGGQSHFVDWYPLRFAVREISQKYPQVKWVIYGQWYNWVHEFIPDDRIEYHPWDDYAAYKLHRGLLDCDINICPLANNPFNICKSDIKYTEASIWERPEATLAANVGPYKHITDGVDGLLYNTPEEFVQKLSALIENADLRKKVAQGAREWTLKNRTPEATIPGLFDYYAEVRARHKRELGVPIIKTATVEDAKKMMIPMR